MQHFIVYPLRLLKVQKSAYARVSLTSKHENTLISETLNHSIVTIMKCELKVKTKFFSPGEFWFHVF